jgi:hypothetical protein
MRAMALHGRDGQFRGIWFRDSVELNESLLHIDPAEWARLPTEFA